MGHDISGYNQAGEEVAYARFSMGNYNAVVLYELLGASEFFAGVSGSGGSSTFTKKQLEKSLQSFKQLFNSSESTYEKGTPLPWDIKQILDFLTNCFKTAKKEGKVRIYFG